MLINEKHVVLKASIQMGLQTKVLNDRIVVAINVSVDSVQSLKQLANERRKGLGERNA